MIRTPTNRTPNFEKLPGVFVEATRGASKETGSLRPPLAKPFKARPLSSAFLFRARLPMGPRRQEGSGVRDSGLGAFPNSVGEL